MQCSRLPKITMFVTGYQVQAFFRRSELIHMQYEMLENSKVGTAAKFCSPGARGMSPMYLCFLDLICIKMSQ